MITGVSVGSINASVLAQYAHDFGTGVTMLQELWGNINCQHIFNASNYELSKSVARILGRVVGKQGGIGYLLDTTPLNDFIKQHVNFDQIRTNIKNDLFDTFEVISNCYETHQTISFYQHNQKEFENWNTRAISAKEQILIKNIF